MRGIVLEDLNRRARTPRRFSIMAPQLFDRHADNIELTRPGDPFAWPAEPTVETVSVVEAVDVSGGYLRLDIVSARRARRATPTAPRGQRRSINITTNSIRLPRRDKIVPIAARIPAARYPGAAMNSSQSSCRRRRAGVRWPSNRRRACRRRCAGRRAVDDQYRHRRYRRTAKQTAELARAGSELVRITVNTPEAAKAVPHIRERLDMMGVNVPLIGDFHYNGHQLLAAEPACAEALAKYRINPGNVGFGKKRDTQFSTIIEFALRYRKPVRIGVNWGSLDQSMVAALMDENAHRAEPWDAARRRARSADPLGARFRCTRRRIRIKS